MVSYDETHIQKLIDAKERQRTQQSEYYRRNANKYKQKMMCMTCGCTFSKANLSKHKKSKRHQKSLEGGAIESFTLLPIGGNEDSDASESKDNTPHTNEELKKAIQELNNVTTKINKLLNLTV